jgi:hypothetical protein
MSLRSRIALVATVLVLAAVLVNTLLQGLAARWAVLQEASDSGNSIAETLARTVSFAEHVPRQVEAEIGRQMLTQARLVAEFVPVAETAGLDAAEISRRLRRAAVPGGAELLATDGAGPGSGAAPGDSASSRSRLRPKPGRLSTAKPALASPRRTAPATVKVATRAPGALRAATRSRTSCRHMAGLVEGEKPSRNQRSARPDHR